MCLNSYGEACSSCADQDAETGKWQRARLKLSFAGALIVGLGTVGSSPASADYYEAAYGGLGSDADSGTDEGDTGTDEDDDDGDTGTRADDSFGDGFSERSFSAFGDDHDSQQEAAATDNRQEAAAEHVVVQESVFGNDDHDEPLPIADAASPTSPFASSTVPVALDDDPLSAFGGAGVEPVATDSSLAEDDQDNVQANEVELVPTDRTTGQARYGAERSEIESTVGLLAEEQRSGDLGIDLVNAHRLELEALYNDPNLGGDAFTAEMTAAYARQNAERAAVEFAPTDFDGKLHLSTSEADAANEALIEVERAAIVAYREQQSADGQHSDLNGVMQESAEAVATANEAIAASNGFESVEKARAARDLEMARLAVVDGPVVNVIDEVGGFVFENAPILDSITGATMAGIGALNGDAEMIALGATIVAPGPSVWRHATGPAVRSVPSLPAPRSVATPVGEIPGASRLAANDVSTSRQLVTDGRALGLGVIGVGAAAVIRSDTPQTTDSNDEQPPAELPVEVEPIAIPDDRVPTIGETELSENVDQPEWPAELAPAPDQLEATPQMSPLENYWGGQSLTSSPWTLPTLPMSPYEPDLDNGKTQTPLEEPDLSAPIPYGPEPDQTVMPGLASEILNAVGDGDSENGTEDDRGETEARDSDQDVRADDSNNGPSQESGIDSQMLHLTTGADYKREWLRGGQNTMPVSNLSHEQEMAELAQRAADARAAADQNPGDAELKQRAARLEAAIESDRELTESMNAVRRDFLSSRNVFDQRPVSRSRSQASDAAQDQDSGQRIDERTETEVQFQQLVDENYQARDRLELARSAVVTDPSQENLRALDEATEADNSSNEAASDLGREVSEEFGKNASDRITELGFKATAAEAAAHVAGTDDLKALAATMRSTVDRLELVSEYINAGHLAILEFEAQSIGKQEAPLQLLGKNILRNEVDYWQRQFAAEVENLELNATRFEQVLNE